MKEGELGIVPVKGHQHMIAVRVARSVRSSQALPREHLDVAVDHPMVKLFFLRDSAIQLVNVAKHQVGDALGQVARAPAALLGGDHLVGVELGEQNGDVAVAHYFGNVAAGVEVLRVVKQVTLAAPR